MVKRILALLVAGLLLSAAIPGLAESPLMKIGDGCKVEDNIYEVDLLLEGNPGLAGLAFYVDYAAEDATLIDMQMGPVGKKFMCAVNTNYTSGLNVSMIQATNVTEDGVLMTLRFRLFNDLEAPALSLRVDAENTFDETLTEVSVEAG